LEDEPFYMRAYINAVVLNKNSASTPPKTPGKPGNPGSKPKKPPFDYELEKLIDEYIKAVAAGRISEAAELKKEILNIADQAYPDRKEEIVGILNQSTKIQNQQPQYETTAGTKSPPLVKQKPTSNNPSNIKKDSENDYSEWRFLRNDLEGVEFRCKPMSEGKNNVTYFRVQVRINFESCSYCNDGYFYAFHVIFGTYPVDDLPSSKTQLKILNTFKDVYTIPDSIPVKMLLNDGSKMLFDKKNEFVYRLPDGSSKVVWNHPIIFSSCMHAINIIRGKLEKDYKCGLDEEKAITLPAK